MTFDEWWDENGPVMYPHSTYTLGQSLWNDARPKPLTDEQIRECWRECGHSAPMAFAQALQKKLGVLNDP